MVSGVTGVMGVLDKRALSNFGFLVTEMSFLSTGIKCGDVTGVGSRVTDQTGAHYEDAVALECLPGHHRESGSLAMTCLAEGVWSGTPLVCARTSQCMHALTVFNNWSYI